MSTVRGGRITEVDLPNNISTNRNEEDDDRKSYYKIPWWFVIGSTVGAAAIITIAVVGIIRLRKFAKAQLERAAELDAMAMAYSDYAESWRATFGLPPIFDHSQTSRFKSKPISGGQECAATTQCPQHQHNKMHEEDLSSLLQSLQSQVGTLNINN